jgi:hypothetical protein
MRADVRISNVIADNWTGAGTQYKVQTPAGVIYHVYIDDLSDVVFSKSIDGGLSWSPTVTVFTGTATSLSIWYDKWSGLAGGLIHMAYAESANDDVLYRTIDTESADALSTQTVMFAGASTLAGGMISLARARGGNVYCRVCIDAGSEGGFFRLPNANVPNGAWDAARTINEALATTDQGILLPGWAADNQDMMLFFWDASANGISRQLYDDSANSWGETAIIADGSAVDTTAASGFPHWDAVVDIDNSQNLLLAWSAIDAANADLRIFKVTESAITELGNVVLNSTDDQGLAALALDTRNGDLYAFYVGKSDGSETWTVAVNVYMKVSTDDGATWGPETLLTKYARNIRNLTTIPRFAGPPIVFMADDTPIGRDYVTANVLLPTGHRSIAMIG